MQESDMELPEVVFKSRDGKVLVTSASIKNKKEERLVRLAPMYRLGSVIDISSGNKHRRYRLVNINQSVNIRYEITKYEYILEPWKQP